MNIALIGYRGSGKTTIGRLLAKRLGLAFVDADATLVERAGKTIKEIFETQGEKAFRDLEAEIIAELAAREGCVIATGGGVILRAENVAALKRQGKVVYLAADAETLLSRIHADPKTGRDRPALTAGGVAGGTREEIERLLQIREPLYRAAADVVVEVKGKSVEEVVAEVVAWHRHPADAGDANRDADLR